MNAARVFVVVVTVESVEFNKVKNEAQLPAIFVRANDASVR